MDKKKLIAAVAPTFVLPVLGAITSAAAASTDGDASHSDSIGSWYSDAEEGDIGSWY
jgi:hypothetical protein